MRWRSELEGICALSLRARAGDCIPRRSNPVQVGAFEGVGPLAELERLRMGERLEVPGTHPPLARPRAARASRVHPRPPVNFLTRAQVSPVSRGAVRPDLTSSATWQECTFLNKDLDFLTCAACGSERVMGFDPEISVATQLQVISRDS